jgi:hypothetical protein
MNAYPSWIHRIPEMIEALELNGADRIDRQTIEDLFNLRKTAAFHLLRRLGAEHCGHSLVITRTCLILRGWVNYFRVGNSSRCFAMIRDWVEKKVRRHLIRASKHQGYGWKRWSRKWLYSGLGLFNDYQVRRQRPGLKVAPAR